MRSALILAGGASTRFGRPKAFAEFRGRPMIAWVEAALRPRAQEVLVSVGPSADVAAFRRAVPGARPVADAVPGRGPIEGLARGLEAARGDLVLVAPCDAPLLRTEVYDALLAALGDADAAVPRLDAFDPVRAVYRREPALRALGDGSVPSPSALVDRLRATFVGEADLRRADPDLRSFLDVNDRGDLAEAEARDRPDGVSRRRRGPDPRTR